MKFIKLTAICTMIFFVRFNGYTQSLPVGTTAVEDYYRRAQMLGITDTNVSFTVRPIFPNFLKKPFDAYYPDTTERRYDMMETQSSWISDNKKLKISLLPLSFQSQFNSTNPYGWNDGPMIPARGLQTLASAGFFLSYGPLTIQFKPEFVYAANNNFATFSPIQYNVVYARYFDIYNNIDLPAQFGTGAYSSGFFGQSSIRLNFNAFSFGLSTENLWWGPGIRNSLLMSNSAPGFAHLTLNTTRPVQTPVGSFEGQLIAGRLENSGYPPLEGNYTDFGINVYVPKPNDWRYLTGVVLTWQPKWTPGLFLGFDQSSMSYGQNLSGLSDYLPFFSPIKQVSAPDNPINQPIHISSVFMRWLWTQEHAELYFEWGQYNNTEDFLQELLEPNNTRAYIFGVRKLLPFKKSNNENILIGVEVTQLQENSITNIENGTEWYVSQAIRQGYTNQGQELGAGIGPGGNLQSVEVSWVKGLKKIGLQFERYVHNNDAYYYIFEDSQDYSRHWVDLSVAATWEWNYKNLIFNAKIEGIQSLDYYWNLRQNGDDPGFVNQTSVFNLQVQAGITYRF